MVRKLCDYKWVLSFTQLLVIMSNIYINMHYYYIHCSIILYMYTLANMIILTSSSIPACIYLGRILSSGHGSLWYCCGLNIGYVIANGCIFWLFTAKELIFAKICINDGIDGAGFWSLIGLHYIHLIIGISLLLSLLLSLYYTLNSFNIMSYSCIFYWHLIDALWIIIWTFHFY